MDFPRLPRFVSLLANDAAEIDTPERFAAAVPTDMLERGEWALSVDGVLVLPAELVEPIEHELSLASPHTEWSFSQIVALVRAGEGEFRLAGFTETPLVLVRPKRARRLLELGVLRFYRGRDDRTIDALVDEGLVDIIRNDVAHGAQLEIRVIDGDHQPVLLASTERFLYRLDEKRLAGKLPAEGELRAERLIADGICHIDADAAQERLASWVEAARSQGPAVIALDQQPQAVLFVPDV